MLKRENLSRLIERPNAFYDNESVMSSLIPRTTKGLRPKLLREDRKGLDGTAKHYLSTKNMRQDSVYPSEYKAISPHGASHKT